MNTKKRPGNLVRICNDTTGSYFINVNADCSKLYPKVYKGELGIYLKHFNRADYYIIYILSREEKLGFCPEEVEFL